jgi:hypothetical protein
MSDCEGCIGPKTCAKLADDFEFYSEQAASFAETLDEEYGHAEGTYWLGKYKKWAAAFKLASGNGVVQFH